MAAACARPLLPLLGALALLGAAPAFAGSGGPTPAAQTEAARPDSMCASHGKDFVRVAGTSTCIRVSGQVQADTYVGSSQGADALAPALKTR